ncbi:MAG: F0F1 ATP synthase subunit B [Elusimicrobia bacterium]|nr:F0F1 ATP synthase subunit B [Elusimicrobiota bacterium]
MDALLNPDKGLIIWTIMSFLILVGLLRALAWGPLLGAVEAREEKMREERERAEKARSEAERIQGELEARLAKAADEAKAVFAKVTADAEVLRARLKGEAEAESKSMLDKTRAQLDEDKRRIVSDLRKEVSELSLLAAERLVKKSVDEATQKAVLGQFFTELAEKKN